MVGRGRTGGNENHVRGKKGTTKWIPLLGKLGHKVKIEILTKISYFSIKHQGLGLGSTEG